MRNQTNLQQIDKGATDYFITCNVHYGRKDLARAGVNPLPSQEEMVAVSSKPVRASKEMN
jgi:hypothetical protein